MTAAAVKSAQRAAERLMVDQCSIDRVTGVTVDPMTGEDVVEVETIYSGKCRMQVSSAQASTTEIVSYVATIQDYQLHIPASAPAPEVGDIVTLTATPMKTSRTGQKFRVAALFEKTLQSSQRVKVEATTGA